MAQLLGLPSCLTQARGRAPGVGSLPFEAQGFSVHPFFQNPEDDVACWLREQLGPSVSLPLSSGRDLASPHRLSASEEMVPRLPRAFPLHGSTRLASLPRVGRDGALPGPPPAALSLFPLPQELLSSLPLPFAKLDRIPLNLFSSLASQSLTLC